MTNPDREELVKLADDLRSKLDQIPFARPNTLLRRIETAIRRLASSEDGVKGEPELVALSASERACYLWPDDTEQARACRAAYIDGAKDYTAPPADAGMRATTEDILECISNKLSVMAESWTGAFSGLKDGDDVAEYLTGTVWANLAEAIDDLTAPGATTKSDGGECVCSGHQQPNCAHYRMGRCADKSGPTTKSDGGVESRYAAACAQPRGVEPEVAPGPSDPSPTRSDVTVDELARFLDPRAFDEGAEPNTQIRRRQFIIEKARALLDQFEIRRKS